MELLRQTTISLNISCYLLLHVLLSPINLVGDHSTKMLQAGHPWERVATQVHLGEISWFEGESHTFGLALLGVFI